MQGTNSITLDFATIVYRTQLLGFNAVRLPFSFKTLYGGSIKDWSQTCATDTRQTIVSATTDPAVTLASNATIPTQSNPPPQTQGVCNDYLPNDTVLNRFLWVVQYFARNGMYVIIDNHVNLDPTVIEDPAQWVKYWSQLMTSIKQDPLTAAYVLVDIMNEPDSQKIRWEAQGSLPGAKDLYLDAMDAISAVIPTQIMLIEGTGQVGEVALCWVSYLISLFQ